MIVLGEIKANRAWNLLKKWGELTDYKVFLIFYDLLCSINNVKFVVKQEGMTNGKV